MPRGVIALLGVPVNGCCPAGCLPGPCSTHRQVLPTGEPHCLLQGMRVLDNACDVSIDSAEEPLALWDILEK